MKYKKNSCGFTLIEILIVIAILGVLILLSSYLYVPAQLRKARDTARKIDFKAIGNGLNQYYDTKGCFPETLPSCHNPLVLGNSKYISVVPCDPRSKTAYLYLTDGSSCSQWFKLYTNLENLTDRNIDDAGCRSGCGPQCQYNYGISSPNIGLDRCIIQPTIAPTSAEPLTPTPIQYACSPGGGQTGLCEPYDDPARSQCPKVYPNDPTCAGGECSEHENRCKDSSGKHVP